MRQASSRRIASSRVFERPDSGGADAPQALATGSEYRTNSLLAACCTRSVPPPPSLRFHSAEVYRYFTFPAEHYQELLFDHAVIGIE